MRKIVVLTFVSLDGVMQAPGGPKEDTSGGFKYGGWTFPFFDDFSGKMMAEQMSQPVDLLLGRKTFGIFASYWPEHEVDWPGINRMTKYVASTTLKKHKWENSKILANVEAIKKLKKSKGLDLQVHGSSNLIQSLLKNNLVDEFWLKIFPVILGKGKRLFGEGTMPRAFKLTETKISPSGVIFATYKNSGMVETGSF